MRLNTGIYRSSTSSEKPPSWDENQSESRAEIEACRGAGDARSVTRFATKRTWPRTL